MATHPMPVTIGRRPLPREGHLRKRPVQAVYLLRLQRNSAFQTALVQQSWLCCTGIEQRMNLGQRDSAFFVIYCPVKLF